MNILRRLWLFVRIVGRECPGNIGCRMGIRLSWEVAGIIHP